MRIWNSIITRKSCSGKEHESSPPLSLDHYLKIVVYDGYVKYEEAEINRSAIMQDFRDKKKNGRLAAILDFLV